MSKRSAVLHVLSVLCLTHLLAVAGCRAQGPAATSTKPAPTTAAVSPELARRIAVLIRNKAAIPFNYDVTVTDRRPSEKLAGYDEVTVMVNEVGKPGKMTSFLLSRDEKSLAQLTSFDLTKDPREITKDAGRPARGGADAAPVHIVVFDDLECPYCARMHAELFPALLNRYGDKVRVTYKDFPLAIHPWATHAAVDADCLADQSTPAYWNYVDYLHAHADEMGGQEKSLTSAKIQLDTLAVQTGTHGKLDAAKLKTCIDKQDEAPVKAGLEEGEQLNLNGVPALFINGQNINGAAPLPFVYRAVDQALLAQGITPPAPVPVPDLSAPVPASAPAAPASPATTRGSAPGMEK